MDIGLILGAFGIKGEVRIMSLNDEPERFVDLVALVVVEPDGSEAERKLEKARVHKGHALVKFEGLDDRTAAEILKGRYVRLVSGELTVSEEARLGRERLVGIEVFMKNGDRLGVLREVIRTGANDVYEIVDGEKSVLLPAISDVILEVDLDRGRMVVDPLPGLL